MTLQADQVDTGVEVGDLFRLVDVDPPNDVAGLPAGIDLRLVSGGSGIKRIGWAFPTEGGTVHVEETYSRWSVMLWSGTTFYGRPPVRIKAVIENDVTGKTFDVRVYDVTNSEVIAELTGIASVVDMTIFTLTPLANVTAGEAVWELQLRRPSGQPNKVEALVGFLQVEFE